MKPKIAGGKIKKIDYLVDAGVLGTRAVITLETMGEDYGGTTNRPHTNITFELNERMVAKHIEDIRRGDWIIVTCVYCPRETDGDPIVYNVKKIRDGREQRRRRADEAKKAKAEPPKKVAKRRYFLRDVTPKRILLSKQKGRSG